MFNKMKERLAEIIVGNQVSHVNFLNNGEVTKDEKQFAYRLNRVDTEDSIIHMHTVIENALRSFIQDCNVDGVKADLLFGLVVNSEDTVKGKIKEGAKPLYDVVRFYTEDVSSYYNNAKSNRHKYSGYHMQGYIKYSEFVKAMEENEVVFNGPKTFEEFESLILNGQTFDISIYIDLKAKLSENKLVRK